MWKPGRPCDSDYSVIGRDEAPTCQNFSIDWSLLRWVRTRRASMYLGDRWTVVENGTPMTGSAIARYETAVCARSQRGLRLNGEPL